MTAKEIADKWALDDGSLNNEAAVQALIEFAQYHVEKALNAALQKGEVRYFTNYGELEDDQLEVYIEKKSILNAYPKENIK